jgi:hypothetical protein
MTLTILTELNFWLQRPDPIPRHLVGSLLFPAYKQAQILRSENCFSLRHSMFSEQKQAYESVLLQAEGRERTTFFSGPNDSAQPSAGRPSAAAVPFFLCGHDSERFPQPLTSASLQRSHQPATISSPLRVAHSALRCPIQHGSTGVSGASRHYRAALRSRLDALLPLLRLALRRACPSRPRVSPRSPASAGSVRPD